MKTREEVDNLKWQWVADSCWDIEDTEGFEEYREELEAWSREWHARWEAERKAKLQARSEKLGVPGNLTLTAYIEHLEMRIQTLEEKVIWGG